MLVWYFVVWDLRESLELVLEVEIKGHCRRLLERLKDASSHVKTRPHYVCES